jgi:glycerol-3-phosphate acyltransferase PlsY
MQIGPFALRLAVAMAAAYLLGSVNAAIILTRILTGRDIRTMGNLNPGTANVGRTFGRGWGAVVFFWDGLKALAPMLAAQAAFFPGAAPRDAFALAAVGLAAVVGHRRPVWHGFHGGGGVASMVFVYGFFIPVETVVGLLLATGLAMVVLPRARYKFGRWVPIFFSVLAPVLAAGGSAVLNVPLAARIAIGGHPWHVVACVAGISLYGVGVNLPIVIGEMRRVATARADTTGAGPTGAGSPEPGPW